MSLKKILVPVDFTTLSGKVVEQAALICSKSNSSMVLLHIVEKQTELNDAEKKINEQAAEVVEKYRISCQGKVRKGSIFKDIQLEAEEEDYAFIVIGTHGVKGLKQKLLGSDILKVITKVPVPVLVIQSTSTYRTKFEKIVLPVATHLSYENILKAVVQIAKIFNSEIHIYSIERPGYEWPEMLKKNLDKTRAIFDEHGIKHLRVNEKQTILSVGFALQTMQYAQKAGADMIAMMSVSSEEYHYFAIQDKENLLTNEHGIPVLCAGNLWKE